jgi:hypothetical protein
VRRLPLRSEPGSNPARVLPPVTALHLFTGSASPTQSSCAFLPAHQVACSLSSIPGVRSNSPSLAARAQQLVDRACRGCDTCVDRVSSIPRPREARLCPAAAALGSTLGIFNPNPLPSYFSLTMDQAKLARMAAAVRVGALACRF